MNRWIIPFITAFTLVGPALLGVVAWAESSEVIILDPNDDPNLRHSESHSIGNNVGQVINVTTNIEDILLRSSKRTPSSKQEKLDKEDLELSSHAVSSSKK